MLCGWGEIEEQPDLRESPYGRQLKRRQQILEGRKEHDEQGQHGP